MSVLKEWFHSITPDERKRMSEPPKKEQDAFMSEYKEKKLAEERQVQEKIYNSPVAHKIVNDLVELFSREMWSDGWPRTDRLFPVKDSLYGTSIHINSQSIEVEAPNADGLTTYVYSFDFEKNGYVKLAGDLERKYFIEFITTSVERVIPKNYHFEYFATMGSDSIYWKRSCPGSPKCDRIRLCEDRTKEQPNTSLKSW